LSQKGIGLSGQEAADPQLHTTDAAFFKFYFYLLPFAF